MTAAIANPAFREDAAENASLLDAAPHISADDLLKERRRCLAAARGGLAMPVAGAIYWIVLGVLGYQLEAAQWAFWAAFLSGSIFPMALLLQGPLKSPFMKLKSPIGGVAMAAIIGINFLWPLHGAVMAVAPGAVVLSLALAMTAHWPAIGWSYASKVCWAHAFARLITVSVLFFAFPEARLTLLPFAVAALYLAAAIGLAFESAWAKRWLERAGA
jgi:hypothetical protein